MASSNAAQESAENQDGKNAQVIDNNEELDKGGEEKALPKVSEAAVKALTKGWQTKEDWTAAGKDPEEWISATHFNKNGDIFTQMQSLKHSIKNQDKRISDNNTYWKGQLEIQRGELEAKRDVAIDDSDKVAVKALDKQLKELDKTEINLEQSAKLVEPATSQADLLVENNYFNDLKQGHVGYAQQVAAHYINNESLSGKALVDAVTKEVNKQFNIETKPNINERRSESSITDGNKSNKSTSSKITVDTLTREDKISIQAMQNISPKYAKMSNAQIVKILNDSKR